MNEDVKNYTRGLRHLIDERFGSVMYGSIFLSWIAFNWRIFYVTFFIDQNLIYQKFGILKLDYIEDLYYLNFFDYGNPLLWYSVIKLILGPLVSTIIAVTLLTIPDRWFHSRHGKNMMAKKSIDINIAREFELIKNDLLKTQKENIDIQKNITTVMSDEEKWEKDFRARITDDYFINVLNGLQKAIYEYGGKIKIEEMQYDDRHNELGYEVLWKLDQGIITFLDVNELAVFNLDNIKLTNKGKYYIKLYMDYQSYE